MSSIKNKELFCFIAVAVIVFACFLPDINNAMLDWDDAGYVIENDLVRNLSADSIMRAFTETRNYYWAPLTWISLSIDHAFWGLNPLGYHLTNNAIHALNAGLFFFICIQLLKLSSVSDPRCCDESGWIVPGLSLSAALLWGVHPMRVESVAWIAERKDVLSSLFGLASILAYLYYARAQKDNTTAPFYSSRCYWLMFVLYILSMMSKATLMLLPLLLLIIDWYPLRRWQGSRMALITEKLPLLLVSGAVSVITFKAMQFSSVSLSEINMVARILTAFKSMLAYLRLTLIPADISPVYFHPTKVTFDAEGLVAILLVVGITALAVLQVRRHPWLFASWFFFMVAVFPVLGLAQSGPTAQALRFSYIPTMPFYLLAVAAAGQALRQTYRTRTIRAALLIGLVSVLAVLVSVTVRDIGYWRNDITLWSRVIELQPRKFGKAYYQRALFYIRAGDYQSALPDATEALNIALAKKYVDVHEIYALRARILWVLRDAAGAIADYTAAIERTDPMHGVVYFEERGAIYQVLGDSARAGQDFEQARRSREWK